MNTTPNTPAISTHTLIDGLMQDVVVKLAHKYLAPAEVATFCPDPSQPLSPADLHALCERIDAHLRPLPSAQPDTLPLAE